MLFGVKTEGQLGGRQELVEAYELFKATYKTTADGRVTQLALNVELAQVIRC